MNRLGPGLAAALGLLLGACARDPLAVHSFSKQLLHGAWDLQLSCRGQATADAAMAAVSAELEALEGSLSPWLPQGELARVNAQAGAAQGLTLSADLTLALQLALGEAEASQGAFDPTAGPLDQAWWSARQGGRPLSSAERTRGLGLEGWRQLRLDPAGRRLILPRAGMGLDLGGLAKGYAQDRVARVLKAHGIKSFLLNAGGQVYAAGSKPDGSPWRVGILDPADSSKVAATLDLQDEVLSTHGDYAEFSSLHGQAAPLTLDPRTGRAVSGGLASVSALLPWDPQGHAGALVEAASLSALILGPQEGLRLLGAQGAEGILIARQGQAWTATVTPGLRGRLHDADPDIRFPDLKNTHP